MIELSNIALPLDAGLLEGQPLLRSAAAKACGVGKNQVTEVRLVRRGVDARKRHDVHFVATLAVSLAHPKDEERVLQKGAALRGVQVKPHVPYRPLDIPNCSASDARPVVVGTGPAGLFAALYLARAGLKPVVLERGGSVEERVQSVDAFFAGGPLDPTTNIQFGEGGAGTFSDGKLTTNIKNPLAKHVLRWFVDAGAPEDILWQGKPHIGTDLLRGVVRTMRQQIEDAGGTVRFHSQMTGLVIDDGCVTGVRVQSTAVGAVAVAGDAGESSPAETAPETTKPAEEIIPATHVLVATGHSARDTFLMLKEAGLVMERKPFSMGVRIEHRQQAINRSQYGDAADHPALGAADYKMAVTTPEDRGVYTFCMCPGGVVVPAASEEGRVCVNGMSYHARDGKNANAAVLVGINPEDLEGEDVLAGMYLQRQVEQDAYQLAFRASGVPYAAPAQRVGDFLGLADKLEGEDASPVEPSYPRGVAWVDLHECLPPFMSRALEQALPLFDRKLAGYACPQAVMTGVEARSSSPVRVVRDQDLQAVFAKDVDENGVNRALTASGVYPCGEGAGYAGGIMSAAADGLRVAQHLCRNLAEHETGAWQW